MELIPVVDVLHGVVVRGVAGRRDEYRPLQSRLTASTDPFDVARALRDYCGCQRLYVADLDAIVHRRPDRRLYERLGGLGISILLDAGIASAGEAAAFVELPQLSLIAGLESLAAPDDLAAVIAAAQPRPLTFSLDLFNGRSRTRSQQSSAPIASRDDPGSRWAMDAEAIAAQAVVLGITELLVLDVADVGMGTGGSTLNLCDRLRERYPKLRLVTGGGVRGPADVERLRAAGLDGVLIASALHDGRFGPANFGLEK